MRRASPGMKRSWAPDARLSAVQWPAQGMESHWHSLVLESGFDREGRLQYLLSILWLLLAPRWAATDEVRFKGQGAG
jgi:hypothetical protein